MNFFPDFAPNSRNLGDLYTESGQTLIFSNFRNFQNVRKFSKFFKFSKIFKNFQKNSKNFKIFENFQNRWTRSGAKAGVAGSFRQELPVAYFVAKYGLHPAENEPLHFQNFRKFQKISKIFKNFQNLNFRKILKIVGRGAVQKLGERVVLGKNCPLRILLQNMVSTQPRTSPGKIASLRQILPNFRRSCRLLRRPFRKFFDAGRCKSWGCG